MELSNPGMFKERSGWSGRDRIAEIHRLPPVIRLIRKRTAGATPGSARISDFPARIRGHFVVTSPRGVLQTYRIFFRLSVYSITYCWRTDDSKNLHGVATRIYTYVV